MQEQQQRREVAKNESLSKLMKDMHVGGNEMDPKEGSSSGKTDTFAPGDLDEEFSLEIRDREQDDAAFAHAQALETKSFERFVGKKH